MSKTKIIMARTGMDKLPACCDVCELRILNWDKKWACGVGQKRIEIASDRDYLKDKPNWCPLMEIDNEKV